MAEASAVDDKFICPICMEKLIEPRSLTTCRHTFCENCILTLVLKLRSTNGKVKTFDCPVCRTSHQYPEEGNEVTLEWIRTFPINEDLKLKEESVELKNNCSENRMTDVTLCDPCKFVNDTNVAAMYCNYCLESLCETCISPHKRLKPTRHHRLVSLLNKQCSSEMTIDLDQLSVCPKHKDKIVEVYCKEDDILCCMKCAVFDHRHCRELHDIASSDLDDSRYDIHGMREVFNTIKTHYENTIEKKENGAKNLDEQFLTSEQEMESIHQKLLLMADKIKSQFYNKLPHLKEKIKLSEKQEVDEVHSKLTKVIKTIDMFENTSAKSPFAQRYFACRVLRKERIDHEAYIQQLENKGDSKLVEVVCKPPLLSLVETQDIEALVDINVKTTYNGSKDRYTLYQIALRNIIKNDEYEVNNSGGDQPTYSDVVMASDDTVLLADSYKNYCSKVSSTFSLTAELKFGNKPTRLTVDNSSNVCYVVVGEDKSICKMSVGKELKIMTNVTTVRQPSAVDMIATDTLAVSWKDPVSFSIVTIKGADAIESNIRTSDTDGRAFKTFDYIAVDTNTSRVFQPCTSYKALYCFKFTGEPVFKYSDKLGQPRGVTVDRDGNVYVCDSGNNSLHQISPTGKQLRLITDGIPNKPLAIAINQLNSKIIMTCESEPWNMLHVFELK